MWRISAAVVALVLTVTGCSWGKSMPEFGSMPPIVPEVTAQEVSGAPPASSVAIAPAPDDSASGELGGDVLAELDRLWAQGDWNAVIDLLESESTKEEPALGPATIAEKLYAAYINAGHAALRQNDKEGAMTHFFAAMEIAPDRAEGGAGLQQIQRSYMDEARQLLETLQAQQQAQAQAEAAAQAQAQQESSESQE